MPKNVWKRPKISFQAATIGVLFPEPYYSMYHAARALLLTKNISPKTHAGVLRMLGLEFVNKNLLESTYSEAFQHALALRSEANYTPDANINKEKVEDAIVLVGGGDWERKKGVKRVYKSPEIH